MGRRNNELAPTFIPDGRCVRRQELMANSRQQADELDHFANWVGEEVVPKINQSLGFIATGSRGSDFTVKLPDKGSPWVTEVRAELDPVHIPDVVDGESHVKVRTFDGRLGSELSVLYNEEAGYRTVEVTTPPRKLDDGTRLPVTHTVFIVPLD